MRFLPLLIGTLQILRHTISKYYQRHRIHAIIHLPHKIIGFVRMNAKIIDASLASSKSCNYNIIIITLHANNMLHDLIFNYHAII
jgi:hypothetical protein